MAGARRMSRRASWRDTTERGYVLVITALMLIPLLAFTGFAVDLGAWISRAATLQTAADAAALAGVVYLPDEEEARTAVHESLARNGVPAGVGGVEVAIEVDNNRQTLGVTVSDPAVDQYFTSYFFTDVDIARAAVAQFVVPVPMGSPEPYLGVDAERGRNPGFVLNIAGRGTRKENGDKRQAGNCQNSHAGCNGIFSGYNNVDYSVNGYFFAVRAAEPVPGEDLSIEVFNPAFVQMGDLCGDSTLPSSTQSTTLDNQYADTLARSRYSRGRDSLYCTGDHRIGGNADVPTTYIVRAPDDTPFDTTDNPPICTITFSPYNQNTFELLRTDRAAHAQLRGHENLPFFAHFRRWFPICTIPAAQVQQGDYIVQIRTNADLSVAPAVTEATPGLNTGTVERMARPAPTGMGHNRFNLRASWGAAPAALTPADDPVRPSARPGRYNGAGLSISAYGHFAIYQQQEAAEGSFYLARVLPTNAGRSLVLTFWDIGDVGSGAVSTVTVVPPAGVAPDCTFLRVTDALGPHPAPTHNWDCTITGMTATHYNGRDVVARIPIPLSVRVG